MLITRGNKNNALFATLTTIAFLSIGGVQDANAQRDKAQTQSNEQSQVQQAQIDVSDTQLEKFVQIQNALKAVRKNNKQGNTSHQEMRQKMIEIIKSNGFNIQEYKTIKKTVRSSSKLRKKYHKIDERLNKNRRVQTIKSDPEKLNEASFDVDP